MNDFRDWLRRMYHGQTRPALVFQVSVIAVDIVILAFFVATPLLRETTSFLWLDYSVAALLAADIAARTLASTDVLRHFKRPTVWVDLFILLTLLLPETLGNLGFLRVLRLWSLSRSGILWRGLRPLKMRQWEEAGHSVVNLLSFLFIITGFVYTFFFREGAGLAGYVDALYFTVATVTTTGFGDIVLPGITGKLTAIFTMIIGISLFVRLAQALFRPHKVFFECPRCALQRHDPDAVHCKACGELLRIPDEGE